MKPLFIILFSFIWLNLLAQPYHYKVPEIMNDGWTTGDVRLLIQDTAVLYKLFEQLHQGPNKLHSMLLVHEGQLIIEEYFNGAAVDEPHDLR